MRFMKLAAIFFFVAFTSTATVFSQNSEEYIKNMLVERDQEIKELLGPEGQEYTDEQRAELKEIINGVIDFEEMAKIALDETYDEISDESRTEFIDLFTTIIRDHSLNTLDIYRAKITYNSIELADGNAMVKTTAELKDVRTPVDYKMELEGENWVITDMSVDDLWTAESYKNQFQRIIQRRGFDTLMESLRKRAARAE
jgi:phospholipid transport system substrate-binding protein